jgi:hypothetical protein
MQKNNMDKTKHKQRTQRCCEKKTKGGALLRIHFYTQIIIHVQKILLLHSCFFPLLQIPCIHNTQGNNFYIMLNSMWIIIILILPTHVQTNMRLNKKTMLCVHTRIHTHFTYTRVYECLHHLLLLHTTIIKMSLSYLENWHWFPWLQLPMMAFLIFSTSLLIDPLSIPPHCFLFPSHSFKFLKILSLVSSSPFQVSPSFN